MKEVLVKIDPCVVEPDDFEDLLATDDLFIEYFNAFLALPTFPEPLFFNKETGGFEIVTDAKERLATEIKAAVRAGRPKKKIYRAVRRHAFMPVPLIPMEEPVQEEAKEIDTSFVVQTLNKEQGIEWIKKERLSSFLESECYLEYRLAHLVSQAQVSADLTDPVSLRLDRTPRKPPTRKPKNEPPPEPDENEDPRELLEEEAQTDSTPEQQGLGEFTDENDDVFSEDIPESIPEHISDNIPLQIADDILQNILENIPKNIPLRHREIMENNGPSVSVIHEEPDENDDTPRVIIPTKAKIMKDMFVCMGSASTTDTEAWVSHAKMAHTTMSSSTSSPRPRPVSAILPPGPTPRGARPVSAAMTGGRPMSGVGGRPISSLSATDSMWRDSGIGSPTKLSLYGSTLDVTGYANSVVSQDDLRESEVGVGDGEAEEGTTPSGPPPHGIQSRLFRPDSKPLTPRTPRGSDTVCLMAEGGARRGGTVYADPPQEDDHDDDASSSASEVATETSSQRSAHSPVPSVGQSGDQPDGANPDHSVATSDQLDEHTYDDLDKLGSVIVGTVLKHAIAKTTGMDPAEVVRTNQVISDLCSKEKLSGLTMADLSQLGYSPLSSPRQTTNEPEQTTMEPQTTATSTAPPTETPSVKTPYFKEPPKGEIKKQDLTSTTTQASDSGEDSMLDSDNEYDEDRDKIFKKRKRKFKLTSKKGIENFKRFLIHTQGEKNWYFWLDVDRGRLLLGAGNIPGYLAAMRERYQLPGAPYELPRETKVDLGLVEPSQWTMEKLMEVQTKVAEPLLLYWTPRFLLQQSSAARPERNYMYNLQRQSEPPGECHPNPPTMGLLPLRPKTCMPRLRQMERPTMTITSMFDDVIPPQEESKELPSTTPRVGMKRTHSLPEIYKDKKKEKEKENQERQRNSKKTPKQLVCARNRSGSSSDMPRPPPTPRDTRSAPDRRGRASRSSDQWDTFSNLSLPSSVRSTPRGRTRPATAMSLTSDYAASEASHFLGGRRMEGLLQALAAEKKAGGVIRKYLDTTGNQLWLDALAFWHELQEYHNMFYADILDVYLLEKKAKFIFSQYIVTGATHDLHCNPHIRASIHNHLIPPYEELFDAAEELVLEMLFDSWSQMIVSDLSTFDKVEVIEVKRHIDTRSRYMVTLQRRGIIKERTKSSMRDEILHYATQSEQPTIPPTPRSGSIPLNYSNVELWLAVPRTREAIMRNYLTIPGTQEVLNKHTLEKRQLLIADVTNLEGQMKHLNQEDQQKLLQHLTRTLNDAVKDASFIDQLRAGEGSFNTLTITDRENIIKQIHVNIMLNTSVPSDKDLDNVTEMYGGMAEENEGFIYEQRMKMRQDFEQGKGPASGLEFSLRQQIIQHLQVGGIEEITQGERDALIQRLSQADGDLSTLSEEVRQDVTSMLTIAAGTETQAEATPGQQLEVLKCLRTGTGGIEALGEDTREEILGHTSIMASSGGNECHVISHNQRMDLMKRVRNGEGEFAALPEDHKDGIMSCLKLAARAKFMEDLTERSQTSVLKQIEQNAKGDARVLNEIRDIEKHLKSADSGEVHHITMRDRESLIEKIQNGELGAAFTDSERQSILKQLAIVKQKETRKILEKVRETQQGKSGGFGAFASEGGTLGDVVKKIEEAGLDLDDIVRPETPDDPMVGYQDPVYDESLLDSIPEEFRDYTLEKLVHNRIELEHFRQYLAENYASMDLLCWMDVEAFRRTPHNEERKRDNKAKEIKTKYMNKKYFFGPNSPAGKEGQEKESDNCRPVDGLQKDPDIPLTAESGTGSNQSNDLRLPSIDKGSLVRVSEVVGATESVKHADNNDTQKIPPLVPNNGPTLENAGSSWSKKGVRFTANSQEVQPIERGRGEEEEDEEILALESEPTEEETEQLVVLFIDEVMAVGGGWGKLLDDRPPTASLLEAQKYVRTRLEKKWLPLFLATPEFADRQRPRSSMDDVVEDVMIQKKKKSQAIWRMLESRWVSSSTDIIVFRKALLNPITSLQFRRFVSIKGDNYENDVLFWQEIQRYKDLCHLHSDRALIQQKTVAIVNCFIDSPIPPALQVDLTQEMADRIVERKLEATPYVFREAQLTVFRVLFPYWSDFCQFRQNLSADKILPTIERHRRRAKAEDRRRQDEIRERKEKQRKQRKAARKLEKQLEKERLERLVSEGQADTLSDDKGPVGGFAQKSKSLQKRTTFQPLPRSTGKEMARRRALGLPVDAEEDEGYREAQHEVPSSGEEDELDLGSEAGREGDTKDSQMAWSYSGYMNALEEEKVLNDVDEATFSCVSEGSSKVPGKEHVELTDDPPSRRGSAKKSQRSEDKPRSRPNSGGSQSGQRPKSSRPRSSRTRDPHSEISHPDHVVVKPPPAPPSEDSGRHRMSRRIPPLVSRSK